jgi:hypothetical protein
LENGFVLLLNDRLVRGLIIAILLVSASLFTYVTPQISAQVGLVTVTATNHDQVTVVEYKNNQENIFDITSVVLKVDDGGTFKSFKTEKGWLGKKTDSSTITFTSTTPVKPGQNVKFGVKTDKSTPTFSWSALDSEGDEIGAGERVITSSQSTLPHQTEITSITPGEISDLATFKIIPDTPRVGSALRIIGENFPPKTDLDFYINDLKIESFSSDEKGSFIVSTEIPENQSADRADFIIKNKSGSQKSMSLRIQGESIRPSEDTELTANVPSIVHRGDEVIISGTAASSSTLTISLSDSTGQVLTTKTVKADGAGNYSLPHRIASDAKFGEYTITITDGRDTVIRRAILETTQKINLVSIKEKYDPGETVLINGTALADQEIELVLRNPVGMEIFSENKMIGTNGTLNFTYHLDPGIREGTYVLLATQQEELVTVLFGVGQLPSPPLIATMDALNYKTTQQPRINVIGPPSATINLIVIDPADKTKFSDSFSLGDDGYHMYSFNLTGYTTGIYTAVVSRGNVQAENNFSVGLQTSTGKVNLRTLEETYHPGDPILVIGDSNPNVIITVSLVNPNGTKVKTQELFTDKKGTYSSSAFRIPTNAQTGTWKITAGSGINHISKDLKVTPLVAGGITVNLDKTNYKTDEIVQITGDGVSVSHTIIIKILKDNLEIDELSIVATGIGTYGTIWRIPTDLSPGIYTIKVVDDKKSAQTTFALAVK